MSFPGLFHLPRGSWKASSIQVKAEYGWFVFYDGETSEPLNQSRPRCPDAHPVYHRPETSFALPNPVDQHQASDSLPPCERPKHTVPVSFAHLDRIYDPRRIRCSTDVDPPQRTTGKYFKGDDPHKRHSRASEPPAPISVSFRTGRSQTVIPSLFKRSLKSQIKRVPIWPSNPYHSETV
jgi:hypothetical protein